MTAPSRFLGLFAALGVLSLVAFAPSSALAHAGHGHSLVETVSAKSQSAPRAESKASSRETAVPRVAAMLSSFNQSDPCCADRNCGDGHCLTFAGVIAPLMEAEFFDQKSAMPLGLNIVPPESRAAEGPPRPPKSLV
jgi:hypothetical protein